MYAHLPRNPIHTKQRRAEIIKELSEVTSKGDKEINKETKNKKEILQNRLDRGEKLTLEEYQELDE